MTDFSEIMDDVRRIELAPVASECDLYGHDYQVREDGGVLNFPDPVRYPTDVFCARCGKSWKVER